MRNADLKENRSDKRLLNISKKTFIEVAILLLVLLAVSVVLTYVIPKGQFGVLPDGNPDYSQYIRRDDIAGIPWYQGVFAPILVFFSADGLALAMLALFLSVISASFQVMSDAGGVRVLVGALSERFRDRRKLLLLLISLLFYCFGAFLGLFEEMLTMLPVVAALCVMLGFDSFSGFLCCILACGLGFASAITNPFTVLLASAIIGVDPMLHIWYRVLIFLVMFGLLAVWLLCYLRRLERDPEHSVTRRHDEALRAGVGAVPEERETPEQRGRIRRAYTVFLLAALLLIVLASVIPALRGYTVPILLAYFLVFGILTGALLQRDLPAALKSFGRGFAGALPTLIPIALAASIKYVFDRGAVLPTIVHQINALVEGRSPITVALVIYLIVLLLEFFISSSTAKAIFVMGLLAVVHTGLTKEMLVLLYTFADGYTNVLFPTSPVLLISLSMIEMDYFRWVKRSVPLFAANLALVILFILLGIIIGY